MHCITKLGENHERGYDTPVNKQQTIITTTHEEFLNKNELKNLEVIELGK